MKHPRSPSIELGFWFIIHGVLPERKTCLLSDSKAHPGCRYRTNRESKSYVSSLQNSQDEQNLTAGCNKCEKNCLRQRKNNKTQYFAEPFLVLWPNNLPQRCLKIGGMSENSSLFREETCSWIRQDPFINMITGNFFIVANTLPKRATNKHGHHNSHKNIPSPANQKAFNQ